MWPKDRLSEKIEGYLIGEQQKELDANRQKLQRLPPLSNSRRISPKQKRNA
jgi:hypothetical protein